MNSKPEKLESPAPVTVGVIGGVGPLATTYYMEKLIRLTDAETDQEHVDLIVMQHATIPDRTAFIMGESTEDPGPVMAADARKLQSLDVSFITMPCNTAHYFVQQVIDAVDVPVLSIIEETVQSITHSGRDVHRVGVLATSGTVHSEVYQQSLARHGLDAVLPDDADQDRIMAMIYDHVKAGLPINMDEFTAVCQRLVERGAEVIVLGCTELSVVAEDHDLLEDPLYVDSLDILARRTIEVSGHRLISSNR